MRRTQEAPRRGGRLWLTGSLQSNAGLLGLVKCARGEPRGEALACVLDASNRYSLHAGARRGDADVGGDSDADLAPLLARAQALGLAYNVFVDGRHGAYRSIAMPVRDIVWRAFTPEPAGIHTLLCSTTNPQHVVRLAACEDRAAMSC